MELSIHSHIHFRNTFGIFTQVQHYSIVKPLNKTNKKSNPFYFKYRWISDSPRWLLKHNKIEKTLQLLLESAAFNNREIPLDLENQLELYAQNLINTKECNYWSIWDGKTPRVFIILIHWAWVVSAVLYNVMILMIRTLGVEHLHVNTACLGKFVIKENKFL